MNSKITTFAVLLAFGVALPSCRGGIKKDPPIHLVWDMDFQQKLKAQSESSFKGFADHRGMRTPPAGTIARGALERRVLETFKDASGAYIKNPLPSTPANVLRGHERYDIFCAPCHDKQGAGKGIVVTTAKGSFVPPPHIGTEPRVRDAADGHLFESITNGRTTMPAYGHMITAEDRWLIVHYLRALQAKN